MENSSRHRVAEHCLLPSWQMAAPCWASWCGNPDAGPELVDDWLQGCAPASRAIADRLLSALQGAPWRVSSARTASDASLVVVLQALGSDWELRVRRTTGVQVVRRPSRPGRAAAAARSESTR